MSDEIIKRGPGRPRKNPIPATPQPVSAAPSPDIVRFDGWENAIIGLGSVQDRSKYTQYGSATLLDDITLGQLYIGDGLASRIVNAVADDCTREWISFLEDRGISVIQPEFERLNAEEIFNTAIRWRRLYGGALVLIGALDGRAVDQPLNETAIRAIEYLKVIDRTCVDLSGSIFDKDPRSPLFGKILKYKVHYTINDEPFDLYIHHSRVVEFRNDPVPTSQYTALPEYVKYWGMSSLQPVHEALRNLGGINSSVVNILYGFCSGTYKFKNLAQLLAAGGEVALSKRIRAIEMAASALNARILDSEEDYTKEFTSLAGLDQLIDRFMLLLTGSTGIPVTRLFGKSPSGLNAASATENDTRTYYDLIEADQRNKELPPLRRLVALVSRLKGFTTPAQFEFNSLYQLTEKEKADLAKVEAETLQINTNINLALIEAGIRDPFEYAKELGYEDEYHEPEPDPVDPPPQEPDPNGSGAK